MRLSNYVIYIVLAVCSLYSAGCDNKHRNIHRTATYTVKHNTLLTGEATYIVAQNGLRLDIWRDPEQATIDYQLVDPSLDNVLLRSSAGSSFSRYFFVCDDESWLWVYSGDVGSSVWRLQGDGTYVQSALKAESPDLVRRMPDVFFEALPHSLKERWSILRGPQ